MKSIFLLLFCFTFLNAIAQNADGVLQFGSETLSYQRHSPDFLRKIEKSQPRLHHAIYWLDIELDKCQAAISKNEKPDLIGNYSLKEQIDALDKALKEDYKKFSSQVNIESYKRELEFYEKCHLSISNSADLEKKRAKAVRDSLRNIEIASGINDQLLKNDESRSILQSQDSIRSVRRSFQHPYGTVFGGVNVIDVGVLDVFLQSPEWMDLNLVEDKTEEIPGGFRNVYENRIGTRRTMNVDYYLDTNNKIKKVVFNGYFDIVVKFYVDYWPFYLKNADIKPGVIERYHNTDKIVFTSDLPNATATITIAKAAF